MPNDSKRDARDRAEDLLGQLREQANCVDPDYSFSPHELREQIYALLREEKISPHELPSCSAENEAGAWLYIERLYRDAELHRARDSYDQLIEGHNPHEAIEQMWAALGAAKKEITDLDRSANGEEIEKKINAACDRHQIDKRQRPAAARARRYRPLCSQDAG